MLDPAPRPSNTPRVVSSPSMAPKSSSQVVHTQLQFRLRVTASMDGAPTFQLDHISSQQELEMSTEHYDFTETLKSHSPRGSTRTRTEASLFSVPQSKVTILLPLVFPPVYTIPRLQTSLWLVLELVSRIFTILRASRLDAEAELTTSSTQKSRPQPHPSKDSSMLAL